MYIIYVQLQMVVKYLKKYKNVTLKYKNILREHLLTETSNASRNDNYVLLNVSTSSDLSNLFQDISNEFEKYICGVLRKILENWKVPWSFLDAVKHFIRFAM